MHLVQFGHSLAWGELDLQLLGINHDWYRNPVNPPAAYSLALDADRLWFVATRSQPATVHPQARPGRFMPELWRHDVAELFIGDPQSGRYLELNLAPNGAWWSAEFVAPRERARVDDDPWPGVETHAELAADGSWIAALAIPLDSLRDRLAFGPESTANVTFILNSPKQQFLSAAPLGDGEPDFHRPHAFPAVEIHDGCLPTSKP
jgi:hypothetical protein